jgi:AAA15 family ATPase/GTPase
LKLFISKDLEITVMPLLISMKNLIIGANDVGKTNLLYAIRLLLDKSLSELDLEPKVMTSM